MNVVILTAARLMGDGLARCLGARADFTIRAVTNDMGEVRSLIEAGAAEVVLVDMTQLIDLEEVRSIAAFAPEVVLIALALAEQRQDVIRCGRAGFSGYVSRDGTVEEVVRTIRDAVAGRLACPAEISGGLLRALFRQEVSRTVEEDEAPLTRREGDVLRLIGRGLTNKEIARELDLSVATVKHHVHNVLAKMKLPGRAQAMRKVRERPWIA